MTKGPAGAGRFFTSVECHSQAAAPYAERCCQEQAAAPYAEKRCCHKLGVGPYAEKRCQQRLRDDACQKKDRNDDVHHPLQRSRKQLRTLM